MGAEPPESAPPAPPSADRAVPAGARPVWPAYGRWRRLAGPLADFVLPAPFLAPWPATPRLPAARGAPALAAALDARAGGPAARPRGDRGPGAFGAAGDAATALFLEAPPRLGLAAGLRLGRAGWTVVPLYGRWPAPGAVLPAERLTGWLLGVACALRPATAGVAPGGPSQGDREGEGDGDGAAAPRPDRLCLLLDSQRARPVAAGVLRRRLDNRYDYPAYLLPPPRRLDACRVGRVLWAAPAAAVPPDLQEYAEALVRAGIVLDLVRLGDLRGARPAVAGEPATAPAAGGRRR